MKEIVRKFFKKRPNLFNVETPRPLFLPKLVHGIIYTHQYFIKIALYSLHYLVTGYLVFIAYHHQRHQTRQ